MKKTVLLLTAVFALGVLVNAQNDCTSEEVHKMKKIEMTNHLDFNYYQNPTDCSNPEKIAYYTTNRFAKLVSTSSGLRTVDAVPNVKQIFSQNPSNVSDNPGTLCCTPPPKTIHRSQLNPNDRQ